MTNDHINWISLPIIKSLKLKFAITLLPDYFARIKQDKQDEAKQHLQNFFK